MSDDKKPKRISHFPQNPGLERQIEEILQKNHAIADTVAEHENTIDDIKDIKEPSSAPAMPTGLQAMPVFKKFVVQWNIVDNADHYVLSYSSSTDDQSTWSSWKNLELGDSPFFIHENLDYEKDYRYRVATVNSSGIFSQWSDIYIAGKPGQVSISEDVVGDLIKANNDGMITLSEWDATLETKHDHWNNMMNKYDFHTKITGTIDSIDSNNLTITDTSKTFITDYDDGNKVKGGTLLSMAVRIKISNPDTGLTQSVIRTITDYTEDTITLNEFSWPTTNLTPSVGDTYEIGTAQIIQGTQIDQTQQHINLMAMEDDDGGIYYFSDLTVAPSEISSTVSEVYPNGTGNESTIQQNADSISLRVTALDENGNPTDVKAQIRVAQLDSEGYIYIGGDQITLDGDTIVDGTFSLNGDAIVDGSIVADKYKQIRNVLPWNFLDNVDQSNPLVVDFHIPSETVNIIDVFLSVKAIPFRAYSTGASGGSHDHEVDIPSHTHDMGYGSNTTNLDGFHSHDGFNTDNATHDHGYTNTAPDLTTGDNNSTGDPHDHDIGRSALDDTTEDDTHDHWVSSTGSTGDHAHKYSYLDVIKSDGDEVVTSESDTHSHSLDFGIYEDTNVPGSIDIYADDNGDGTYDLIGNYTVDADGVIGSDEINVTGSFSLNDYNWKKLKFEIGDTTSRVRISGQLIAKVDITA